MSDFFIERQIDRTMESWGIERYTIRHTSEIPTTPLTPKLYDWAEEEDQDQLTVGASDPSDRTTGEQSNGN